MKENGETTQSSHGGLQSLRSKPTANGSDTPTSTAPSSPNINAMSVKNSGLSTPTRSRPTTLDIPGLTRSKASPDGRIAQRDVGSKLVIVMVGLPARGKSYVTKKIARYLNWQQHNTKIFNVGERRREAAGGPNRLPNEHKDAVFVESLSRPVNAASISLNVIVNGTTPRCTPAAAAKVLVNGLSLEVDYRDMLPSAAMDLSHKQLRKLHHADDSAQYNHKTSAPASSITMDELPDPEAMEQNAHFFDPQNVKAAQIREQVALATLNDLLDYILDQGGSVGIFDATNSTLERRNIIMKKIRERAGPELGVLFLESQCLDQNVGQYCPQCLLALKIRK